MIPYTRVFAQVLCSRLASSSKSLKAMCEEQGMPSYATLLRWRMEHAEFASMLDKAHSDQADYRADKILDEIDASSHDADELANLKLKLDATKWITQVHKPAKYAPRTKVMGDPTSPLQFVIETGIRRESDEGYNIDETAKLRDVTTQAEGVSVEATEENAQGVLAANQDPGA